MDPSVHLSFRYTEDDYVRAFRAHHTSRRRLFLDAAVAVVLAACGAFLYFGSPSGSPLGVASLVMAADFPLFLAALYSALPQRAFRREPKFRDEYALTFSPEGVHFRTSNIDSRIRWGVYTKALIDAHSYLLYRGAREFTLIPRRVFRDDDQRRAFDSLLEAHVPEITRSDGEPNRERA